MVTQQCGQVCGPVSARAQHHPQGVELQYVVTRQCGGDQAAKRMSEGEGANPKVAKHSM